MGKFDGVLLVTDYDDTLYSTGGHVSPGNHAAIRRFVEEGGRFTIATGRAFETFSPQIEREGLLLSAPAILFNGSAIYDYGAGEYLWQSRLDAVAAVHLERVMAKFPELGFETYHEGRVYACNPNEVTWAHLKKMNVPYTLCGQIADMPLPWGKLVLQQDHPVLARVQQFYLDNWGGLYEAIFSNHYLLEVTSKGCSKGAAVLRLAEMLGIDRKNVYCMGDNQNDIPMLEVSAIPFAPANCADEVRAWGPRLLNHCDKDAVAQAIGILDGIYG